MSDSTPVPPGSTATPVPPRTDAASTPPPPGSDAAPTPSGTPPPAARDAVSPLDALRKHAKRQLKRARSGDNALLGALRALLPRLAGLSDAQAAAQLKLADIHQAIAREQGDASWGALRRRLEALDPLAMQAARFLRAVRQGEQDRAEALYARHPGLARFSIHTAAALGNADHVAALLRADAAQAHPGDGWPPLLYVCQARFHRQDADFAAGSLRCAELLLAAGASPNSVAPDPDGGPQLPALYYACIADNAPVVRLLLQRGANPNDGESLPHSAEENHYACLELLVAHGADLSAKHPDWDNTPLYFLTGYFEGSPRTEKYLNGIRWLLEHGADPNVPSYKSGETPLHRNATFNHGPELAELLLAHGAKLDAPRADGRTPYAMAVRTGNQRLAEYLRAHGADATRLAPVDELLGAAMRGDALEARAAAAAHPEALASLTDEDRQSVANAAWLGFVPALRVLVELGFDVASEGVSGGTPLHAAAWHGNTAAVRELLDLGAPVNVRDKTYGSSPLAWAAHGSQHCRDFSEEDYCAVVRLLLDAGSDRAASINQWGEPPETLCSKAVREVLRERGFAP